METSEFRSLFASEVRSAINWDLLEARCGISLEIITEHQELGELQTVWHLGVDGVMSDWRDRTARRLTVAEAARLECVPSPAGAKFIRTVASEYSKGLHPRVWGIPLYKTKSGSTIVLDGNHRATALLRSGAPIRLLGAVAHGFDSAELLPDLLRDTVPQLTDSDWATRVSEIDDGLEMARL